jgi:hypothetical protein
MRISDARNVLRRHAVEIGAASHAFQYLIGVRHVRSASGADNR